MAANRYVSPNDGLPLDVQLMQGAANALLAVAVVAIVALALWGLARLPVFTLQSIHVEGDVGRSSESTLRANAAPRLAGNFFTVDLDAARHAFEAAPWVRRAVVSREWPNRLSVRLEEHVAAAYWRPEGRGDDPGDALVNSHGEVFETNLGEVEDDDLPTFGGPTGTSAAVLDMYRALEPVVARVGVRIDKLVLSARGSWRAQTAAGAVIELGRGSQAEVLARCERFVATLSEVTARYQRPLEFADLRHRDGYAVRLKGITTTAEPAKAPRT